MMTVRVNRIVTKLSKSYHLFIYFSLLSRLTIRVYGWYNGLYDEARNNNGELPQNTNPLEVQYISYSSNIQLFSRVASSDQFLTFDFRVSLSEIIGEPTSGPDLTVIVIGIVCGVVFAGLVIILIIVLVCVFGRKRDSPRKRR